jgi:hypothetical protein
MAVNIPNRNKIYQHFQFRVSPKYTQIGIFGMKKYTIWQPSDSSQRIEIGSLEEPVLVKTSVTKTIYERH